MCQKPWTNLISIAFNRILIFPSKSEPGTPYSTMKPWIYRHKPSTPFVPRRINPATSSVDLPYPTALLSIGSSTSHASSFNTTGSFTTNFANTSPSTASGIDSERRPIARLRSSSIRRATGHRPAEDVAVVEDTTGSDGLEDGACTCAV